MKTTFDPTKTLVKHILRNARDYNWSLQGFGMLRLYLPDDTRLHVWDERYQVPNVSLIHDHPWDFESVIVAGELHNTRYYKGPLHQGSPMMERTIRPGEGFEILAEDVSCQLVACAVETYKEGARYLQAADEIHGSSYVRGTVTLVKRRRVGADVAKVYYPAGEEWVSGEPRKATEKEVIDICDYAHDTWFK